MFTPCFPCQPARNWVHSAGLPRHRRARSLGLENGDEDLLRSHNSHDLKILLLLYTAT